MFADIMGYAQNMRYGKGEHRKTYHEDLRKSYLAGLVALVGANGGGLPMSLNSLGKLKIVNRHAEISRIDKVDTSPEWIVSCARVQSL